LVSREQAHPLITTTYQDNDYHRPHEAPDESFIKVEPAAVERKISISCLSSKEGK
jgi:hypothetical protein